MKRAFFLLAALISYGSLYPFDLRYPDSVSLQHGIDALFGVSVTSRGDILGNLVLFVPFGLVGMLAFGRDRGRVQAGAILLTGGVFFAALLQLGQVALPSRDPSGFDVVLNALGIAVGLWLASLSPVRDLAVGTFRPAGLSLALVLGGLWPIAQLLPLIPTVDSANVRDAFKPLLLDGAWSTTEGILSLLAWLATLWLLTQSPIPRRWTRWLPLLPLGVLLAQPFVVNGRITSAEVVGSSLAAAIWVAAGRRIDPLALGLALLGASLAANLLPWVPSDAYRAVSLVPFSGFLEGNMLINTESLLEKVFLFAATICLLSRGGISTIRATTVVTIALMVQEVLQAGLVRGTPEITDPFLAMTLGVAIARYPLGQGLKREPDTGRLRADEGHRLPTASVPVVGIAYLPGLNGLRAIAALSVFLVHLHQTVGFEGRLGPFDVDRWLTNGNTGVALFFVLSGFLLALPFLAPRRSDAGPPRLGPYFLRRLARILPAYYLCLIGLVFIDVLRGGPPSINNVLSHLLFVYNINDWQILSLNEPFWTLAVEVHFYLVLPFLMLALRRLSPRVALAGALILAVSAYVANRELVSFLLARDQWPIQFTLVWPFSVYISGPQSFVLTYSTLAHLTFFLIGVVIAAAYPAFSARCGARQYLGSWMAEALFWFSAAAVFVVLSTPLDDALQLPFGRYNWPYIPLLLALLIVVTPHTRFAQRVLEWRPLWALGVISYGIYIFHYPILRAGEQLMRWGGLDVSAYWPVFAGTSFGATVIVSVMSYLLLERPIMRWVRDARHGRTVVASSSSSRVPRSRDAQVDTRSPASRLRRYLIARGRSPGEQWTQVFVRSDEDRWVLLCGFARAQGRSLSGAARLLTDDWLCDGVGTEAVAAHSARERARSNADRLHWCEVNFRQRHLHQIEQRLKELDLTLDQLIACLLEHRRSSLDFDRGGPTPPSDSGPPA
jgi:peptidoglycan/LPS O-acetylase OafA/YrhL